jgi:cupin 2 domain-containing protein
MIPENIFTGIPETLTEEHFTDLAGSGKVRIERIVSRGQGSPENFWYDQPHTEWVMVLCGHARLAFENRPAQVDLGPGDHLTIPAHVRHRVVHTATDQDTVWLAVHWE